MLDGAFELKRSDRPRSTVLSASLSSALLKFMADKPIVADDVRAIDPMYFKNRIMYLLEVPTTQVAPMAALLWLARSGPIEDTASEVTLRSDPLGVLRCGAAAGRGIADGVNIGCG